METRRSFAQTFRPYHRQTLCPRRKHAAMLCRFSARPNPASPVSARMAKPSVVPAADLENIGRSIDYTRGDWLPELFFRLSIASSNPVSLLLPATTHDNTDCLMDRCRKSIPGL